MQTAFGIPATLAAVFGLGPLFVVAGWLSGVSVARHGGSQFIWSRLLRLGVPALLFLILIGPAAGYLGAQAEGRRVSLGHYLWGPVGDWNLGPMWFVVALLLFSLVYAA